MLYYCLDCDINTVGTVVGLTVQSEWGHSCSLVGWLHHPQF